MITEEHLIIMKPTAFLINTSRSQILASGVVEEAIREKWIAGAAFDVWRDDEELNRFEQLTKDGFNFIVTRHIGGFTFQAREQTDNFIFERVKEYVESKP